MKSFEKALKKYLDIFSGQERYFINDVRTRELFMKSPLNTNEDDIRTKLSAMNDNAELRQVANVGDVVKHILDLKIDERLGRGDLSLVEDLAKIASEGKSYFLLNFASTYCNFHRPDLFPIYSEQHFGFYKEYIKEHHLGVDAEKLNTYVVFAKVLNDLIARYGLKGKMNYLEMRKFGWLYIDYVMKESGVVVPA